MVEPQHAPLSATVMPSTSLGLHSGRALGAVIGRPRELAALQRALASARSRTACIVFEGEPGIGKTRLLMALEELTSAGEVVSIAVTADEEIRGPLLLARSIFASPALLEAAAGTAAEQPVQRAAGALLGTDEPGLEAMSPDRKLLRIYDLTAFALGALAAERPLAILVDDLQWADEDSLRMFRYLVRTGGASPMLLAFAIRPDETAFVNEAVILLADLDRAGMLQRLRLSRFSQLESTELLQQVLGGRVELSTAAVMHAQAEGVPFILAEQALAYRDAGLVQQIDGVWSLARNAQRLLPSAVRTLIQRRSARLPDATKAALAEAAVLGRNFSLRDLAEVERRLGREAPDADSLAESLAPAVAIGLLTEHAGGGPADYTFTHEGVREYALSTLPASRRRTIHAAIVDMLTTGGDSRPECQALLAHHAMAAGQGELAARASVEAARAAVQGNAPEEALRLVEIAQHVASAPKERVALLRLRDDALTMLRRSAQRLEGLPELAALAEALGDSHLEFDVTLRRAAALRLSDESDAAALLAQGVRGQAAERGDAQAELAACMELGQCLLGAELGEAFVQTPSESDLDGAEEAYERAVGLAELLADEASVAAASRELGVISTSRVRAGFMGMDAHQQVVIMGRLTGGELSEDILPTLPIGAFQAEATARFQRALDIYERLGDRQGIMATIIAMAVVSWAPDIHLIGSTRHIEEIRRLHTRRESMTRESERALADAQMLYGSHMYARTRLFADVALTKGEETYTAARALGDRGLEFAAAGGVALEHAQLGAIAQAGRWLERAAAVASEAPTPLRARQLELWRGRVRWAAGDAEAMRRHLEQAAALAAEQGLAAARCEAFAQLALHAAWLGGERREDGLLDVAERAAGEAKALAPLLPGHPPWGAQADAALARVAFQRGAYEEAAAAGRAAFAALREAMREDLPLETMLPAAEAVLQSGGEEERAAVRGHLRLIVALVAQRIVDEDVRVRWFGGRLGRELTRLAGPLAAGTPAASSGPALPVPLAAEETELLRLVAEGRTNAEVAEELQLTEDTVARRLAVVFAKIGAGSRADATAAALIRKLV